MTTAPTDKQKTDQIVAECLVKAAHVVLGSRSESTKQSHHPGKKSWFNLNIDEVAAASQAIDVWRTDINSPAYIEVYLRPWGASEEQSGQHSTLGHHDICLQSNAFPSAVLLERWLFHYEPAIPDGNLQRRRAQLARLDPPAVYKRAVVMLRSLTSYVRLLPGYRMYRACKKSSSPARLGFCLLKGHQSSSGTAKTANLRHFSFTALDTPYGQLKLEVDYAPAAAVNFLEQSTSPGHQPDFIPDYVRGANPVDRRRSSDAVPRGGLTASLQGSQRPHSLRNPGPAEKAAAAADALQRPSSGLRRHSWSREVVRISPPSPSALTPFAGGNRPPLAAPSGVQNDASLVPSPSLPSPSPGQVSMSPLMQARMQRTTSTPAQPQVQSSWRLDLPDEAVQDSVPASTQSLSQQPVLCTSPPVQAAPSRAAAPRTTGTEPVCIPNSKLRVFSTNDLTSLGGGGGPGQGPRAATGGAQPVMVRQYGFPANQGSAPSSAPASTGFMPPSGSRQVGLLKAVASKPPLSNSPSSGPGLLPPTPPNAPGHPFPGSSDAGSSSSSATFAYMPSGSPQLPFAFTPSPHSLPTLAGQGSMKSSYLSPSPPISGRDISALAVIRRPSWSGAARTSSYDGSTAAAGPQGVNMGSPMQDSLDSSFFGSSAARQMLRPGSAAPHSAISASMALILPNTGGLQGSTTASFTAPRLTYHQEPDMAAMPAEESESDILPFAIDGDNGPAGDAMQGNPDLQPGTVCSAEAVVKWLEVHPYLHAAQHSNRTTAHSEQQPMLDAQQELERLSPIVQSALAEQELQ